MGKRERKVRKWKALHDGVGDEGIEEQGRERERDGERQREGERET